MSLPSFERGPHSPPLPATGSAMAIARSADGLMSEVLLHGSYRVSAEDRAGLGPHRVRHQLWIVAIHRTMRATFLGRPGADSVVFADEEPSSGAIEGAFTVNLAAALRLPKDAAGTYDVTAVLGPVRSVPVGVLLRSG